MGVAHSVAEGLWLSLAPAHSSAPHGEGHEALRYEVSVFSG